MRLIHQRLIRTFAISWKTKNKMYKKFGDRILFAQPTSKLGKPEKRIFVKTSVPTKGRECVKP